MISLQRVTKVYRNGTTALEDVTVEVEKGEFVFIVGPSGSGKSTAIRLMLKEEEATKGDIYVAGKNLAKLTSWKVRICAGTSGRSQDFKLPGQDRVRERRVRLEVIGKPKHVIDQRVAEILSSSASATDQQPPDELSGGEQRVLDRACVNRPPCPGRRADEPRPSTSVEIMRLLDKVNRIGTTVVMATHDQAIVDAMRRRGSSSTRARSSATRRGVYA